MTTICRSDPRRDAVRRFNGRNGLDYVEVGADQRTLHVYFLGKLPAEFSVDAPDLPRYLQLEGGVRVTGIRILDVDPQVEAEPDRDDFLVVRLDRYGDFSSYRLALVGVADIDPQYAAVAFSFKVDCPSDLDCQPVPACPPPVLVEPEIDYLAKDYASFRRLLFDRLAVLMPDWRERHVPDLGVTLVELLAYVGDDLSYQQDAVATEAYLATARQRISVRRHARLVDYVLHEGCNARAWVAVAVSQDIALPTAEVGFITGFNDALALPQTVLNAAQLASLPPASYEYFEPLGAGATLHLVAHHSRICFYTWGRRECCLARGATQATLRDTWLAPDRRALQLQVGDVLIFEEVRGPRTGLAADADPGRRHAVRLTAVTAAADPLFAVEVGADRLPAPLVDIAWCEADALPFPLCLSAVGGAPACAWLDDIAVAHGNVVLVDHGRTLPLEPLGTMPAVAADACCECIDQPADVQVRAGRHAPILAGAPLTWSEPAPGAVAAAASLAQDPRRALPRVSLTDDGGGLWQPRLDLFASGPNDAHFVVETDNERRSHLRFGDGELGCAPRAGASFTAHYRVGSGRSGNVGAAAIARLVLKNTTLSGIDLSVRNPLPASGGTEPEAIAEAKLNAPRAFRQRLERAVIAADYAELAQRDPRVQRAAAELVWTGSWYEADVAIDAFNQAPAPAALLAGVAGSLHRYRRMGHDLHVEEAVHVPIDLGLEVCVLPGYDRGHVKAELLRVFGAGVLAGAGPGYFHADRLTFGEPLRLSHIVATAQAVAGVECARVRRLQRLFEPANGELAAGLLPLAGHEIARLDSDPNYPERGQLEIRVLGGR